MVPILNWLSDVLGGEGAAAMSFSAVAVLFAGLTFALSFPAAVSTVALWAAVVAAPLVVLVTWVRRQPAHEGLIVSMTLCLTGVMAFLAGYVQPAILESQPSRELGALVRREDPSSTMLPVVFAVPAFSYSFYAQRDATYLMPDGLKVALEAGKSKVAVFGQDGPLEALTQEGISYEVLGTFTSFSTSRPNQKFLLASTRAETLIEVKVLRVWLTPPAQ